MEKLAFHLHFVIDIHYKFLVLKGLMVFVDGCQAINANYLECVLISKESLYNNVNIMEMIALVMVNNV